MAGFDDTSFAGFAWPPLTTVRQPVVQVAQVATDLLLDRLQDRSEELADQRLRAAAGCPGSDRLDIADPRTTIRHDGTFQGPAARQGAA